MQYIASNRSTTNIFTSTCSQLAREQYLLLFSVRNEDRFAKPYLQYRKPKSGTEKTVSREVVYDSYGEIHMMPSYDLRQNSKISAV